MSRRHKSFKPKRGPDFIKNLKREINPKRDILVEEKEDDSLETIIYFLNTDKKASNFLQTNSCKLNNRQKNALMGFIREAKIVEVYLIDIFKKTELDNFLQSNKVINS